MRKIHFLKRNNDVIGIFRKKKINKTTQRICKKKKGDKDRRKRIHWECSTDQAQGSKNTANVLLHKFINKYGP